MDILQKIKNKIYQVNKDRWSMAVIILFVIGAFLRFYRLYDFVTFLGDQGRDAIIIKRILTLEHFPAIGPTTSIGNIYLGPFYYYFISPWLLLFRFEPIGLAVGTAIISSLFIPMSYLMLKDLYNEKIALLTAVLITFSAILVEFSRFSWNPNLLPMFSLITFYLIVKAIRSKRLSYYFLVGAFLSFTIQLHYIGLTLLPATAILLIINFFSVKPKFKEMLQQWLALGFSFVFFSLPLLIFDLRHQFLNSKNFYALFFKSGAVRSHRFQDLVDTFTSLTTFAYPSAMNNLTALVLLILILAIGYILIKKSFEHHALVVFFLIPLLITSFYSGVKHPHYLGHLYPFYYIFVGYVLMESFWTKKLWPILAVIMMMFIIVNVPKYYFFFQPASLQITKAKQVAKKILPEVKTDKYQMTGLPDKYSDSTYRYFLEIWGKRPLEKDSLEKAKELFIVCEGECQLIGNPQWEIAYFAPTKVMGNWNVEGVRIYKLVR